MIILRIFLSVSISDRYGGLRNIMKLLVIRFYFMRCTFNVLDYWVLISRNICPRIFSSVTGYRCCIYHLRSRCTPIFVKFMLGPWYLIFCMPGVGYLLFILSLLLVLNRYCKRFVHCDIKLYTVFEFVSSRNRQWACFESSSQNTSFLSKIELQ